MFAFIPKIKRDCNCIYSSFLIAILLFLVYSWTNFSFTTLYLDTDIARDLSELSNLFLGRIVWIGPRLSPGLHASPIYYYLLLPGLLITGGNAASIILTTIFIALLGLMVYYYFSLQKNRSVAVIAVFLIGLMPWFSQAAVHPGNGYTYGLLIFIALNILVFTPYLWLSSLLMGLALSFHPAAIFALPLLAISWLRQRHKLVNLVKIFITLVIPWTPIIAYEFITKGFLTRQFLQEPEAGFSLGVNLHNLEIVTNALGLQIWTFAVLWILVGIISFSITNQKQHHFFKYLKPTFILSSLILLTIYVLGALRPHYLIGIEALITVTIIIHFLAVFIPGAELKIPCRKKIVATFLLIVLIFWLILLGRQTLSHLPAYDQARNIIKMKQVTQEVVKSNRLYPEDKIAVVAALEPETKVPQADDYRFFLRMAGYNVLEVNNYSQADKLVMFIEADNFNWQHWNNWEISSFGEKKKIFQTEHQQINIIVWQST